MANDKYVLDASVAAKWFLEDEDHTELAERFLYRLLSDEVEMHAPGLLRYEIGHILRRALTRGGRPIDPDKSLKAYKTFCEYPIVFHHLDDQTRLQALSFANKYNRGFYDSSYICLALKLDCRWLTAERRFGGELPRGFPTKHVLTLESLSAQV